MSIIATDGYCLDDLIVYRGLDKGGVIGRGYEVTMPDLENADPDFLETLEEDMRIILASLKETERLQIQYYVGNDYRKPLKRFMGETERLPKNEWSLRRRNERFLRYVNRMKDGKLLQANLRFYFSSKLNLSNVPKGKGRRQAYEYLVETYRKELDQKEQLCDAVFGGISGGVRGLSGPRAPHGVHALSQPHGGGDGHGRHRVRPDAKLSDEHAARRARATGKAGLRVLPGWPVLRRPGGEVDAENDHHGHGQRADDFADAGLPGGLEHHAAQRGERDQDGGTEYEALHSSMTANPKLRMLQGMATKMDRTARLMSNKTSPFRVQMMVFAHDKTKEGLRAKIAALKSSMNKLGGMQYYEPSWEAAALSYWNAGLPGWAWDRYDDFSHKIDDVNLANILPVSSTPKADLEEAEWLHDGDRGNLIGGRLFEGAPGNESPAHAMVFGSSGAGKSVLLQDILTQTEPYCGYTALIDNGLVLQVLLEDAFPRRAPRGHPRQRHEHDQLSGHARSAVVLGSARQRHGPDAAPDGSARR